MTRSDFAESSSWRIAKSAVLTFALDGLWAVALTVFIYKNGTFSRLWQGVASVVLGPSAFEGGATTTLIGLIMHLGVALFWSGVFMLLYSRHARLRSMLGSTSGVLAVAAVYGPFVWIVMSLVVIPVLAGRPPTITVRWFIQAAGHVIFVGLPIAWAIGATPRTEGKPRG